jgi:hypothetical protein
MRIKMMIQEHPPPQPPPQPQLLLHMIVFPPFGLHYIILPTRKWCYIIFANQKEGFVCGMKLQGKARECFPGIFGAGRRGFGRNRRIS